MVESRHTRNNRKGLDRYHRLTSMSKISFNIVNNLYSPIDATNRFINLALQHTEEDSQSRQFLLESKVGIRKMAVLLKRLNNYARKMERELNEITKER